MDEFGTVCVLKPFKIREETDSAYLIDQDDVIEWVPKSQIELKGYAGYTTITDWYSLKTMLDYGVEAL